MVPLRENHERAVGTKTEAACTTPVKGGQVMSSHYRNKLTAVSCAMAAAGILTCAAALLEVFIPGGSLVGFLARMALLGFAVTGIVIGYTWVCDKCESYFIGGLDRFLDDSEPNRYDVMSRRAAVSPRPTEPKASHDTWPAPEAPEPPFRSQCVPTFRGTITLNDFSKVTATHTWHGQ